MEGEKKEMEEKKNAEGKFTIYTQQYFYMIMTFIDKYNFYIFLVG